MFISVYWLLMFTSIYYYLLAITVQLLQAWDQIQSDMRRDMKEMKLEIWEKSQ